MLRRVIPIISIIVAVGIAGIYAYPKYEEIQELRAKQATFTDALDTAKQVGELTDSLERNMEQISDREREILMRLLPRSVDKVAVFNDLSGVARTNNVQVSNVTFNTEGEDSRGGGEDERNVVLPQGEYFNAVPIQFSVTGDYADILAFLSDMERSVQLFDIVQADLETSGAGAAQGQSSLYTFNITAATYRINTP